MPEFNLTITDLPTTAFKKLEGDYKVYTLIN